jgi:hypothetical protein
VQQLQRRLSHAAASNAKLNDMFKNVRLLASCFSCAVSPLLVVEPCAMRHLML